MNRPVEEIQLSGVVSELPNGTYAVDFRVAGLTMDDANAISALLQPLINRAVVQVVSKRGKILPADDAGGNGKPH
jgi:hypothetical protein